METRFVEGGLYHVLENDMFSGPQNIITYCQIGEHYVEYYISNEGAIYFNEHDKKKIEKVLEDGPSVF